MKTRIDGTRSFAHPETSDSVGSSVRRLYAFMYNLEMTVYTSLFGTQDTWFKVETPQLYKRRQQK
jgi:hypothetical protein